MALKLALIRGISMHCLVTGAAGFIGSHLCEELLRMGHDVIGLDAFIPYYPPEVKEKNLAGLLAHSRFSCLRLDLRRDPLERAIRDADVVFHLAARPGLGQGWSDFDDYWACNAQATGRLLEAVRSSGPKLQRFLYISTSSVYGKYSLGDESLPTRPISAYGVTKFASEHVCRAYADTYGLPLVILRYFSVYGPRQRPDMGYYRFIRALRTGEPISVYGDGQQVRGNTYVSDCVAATLAAVDAKRGEIYNVGGGETASVWDIIRKLESIAGCSAIIRQEPARTGDQRHTFADTTKMRTHFGWAPRVTLDEGLTRQWEWQKENT
jgi:nucleoside-diphosphate-sugar epimerase